MYFNQIPAAMSSLKLSIFSKVKSLFTLLFSLVIVASLYIGWNSREKLYLTAEEGLGYTLGIVGGTMMLVLLLYPARKNFKFMHNLLPVRYWFRLHMLLGVLGPVLIIFHSGFHLGSTNSTVALVSMLIVASSGLFGRYFYSKIHHGLYGRRKTIEELLSNAKQSHSNLDELLQFEPKLTNELQHLTELIIQPTGLTKRNSLMTCLKYSRTVTSEAREFKKTARKAIKQRFSVPESKEQTTRTDIKQQNKHFISIIEKFVRTAEQKAEFFLFEKLFSLWHVLHVPLFILLVITSIFHVYAVHVY